MKWLLPPIVILAVASAVTGEYVVGRILAPQFGLSAPGWGAWFWASTFAALFAVPVHVLKGMTDASP